MKTSVFRRFREKYIGDKTFYAFVLAIAVPIIIQNGISSFVSMLDNIMVGRIGTEEMSGVSIVNQLHFVYMLCMFGGLSGIGIFTAQYYGAGDLEGIRKSFRMKFWMGLLLTVLGAVVFLFFGSFLITLYLNDEGNNTAGSVENTLHFAEQYLGILLLSFPAFFLIQLYTSTLRECGETVLPMKAGVVAVLLNLIGNFLLIYGHLGLPKLGVRGAAIATVLSRYVEMLMVVIWTHTHQSKEPWVKGLYRTLIVPIKDVGRYLKKGLPLLLNEALWSLAYAVMAQCYSMRGLAVVAGLNIANTLNSFLNIIFITMGSTIGIVVGQLLGAGKLEEAKDKDNKMIFLAVASSLLTALLLIVGSFFFPQFYNTTDEARSIASSFLLVYAAGCPVEAFMNGTYFTLRAGGRTVRTFFFDSVSLWVLSVPIAFVLSRFTNVSAIWIAVAVLFFKLFKVVLGYIWVRKNIWLVDLVGKKND